MQTAEFDYKDFQTSEADKLLLVKFEIKSVEDKEASKREGRPIFKEREYIDIKIPGNRSAGACRPATREDKRRFPEHYARFKQRIEVDPQEGTPLSEWMGCTQSQANELAFFHVKTVEQLANMADVQIGKFRQGLDLKQRAQNFLKMAEESVSKTDLQKQLDKANEENRKLRADVDKLLAANKPKVGRPRKGEVDAGNNANDSK